MAELYRHTDEDGAWVEISTGDRGELIVVARDADGSVSIAELFEPDGRRLLAALLSYYGPRSEEITKEEERHG